MDYTASPDQFGLSPAEGDAIYDCYVEQKLTMAETRKVVERDLACSLTDEKIRRFINANGWKRPQSYYARRSPWQGLARASIAEVMAKRRAYERD